MARRIGVVVALTPVRVVVARIEGTPPRIGSRVRIGGTWGRVVDVIGNVRSPYMVVKPGDFDSVRVGDEVYSEPRRRRRFRGRGRGGRGRGRLSRRPRVK